MIRTRARLTYDVTVVLSGGRTATWPIRAMDWQAAQRQAIRLARRRGSTVHVTKIVVERDSLGPLGRKATGVPVVPSPLGPGFVVA